TRENLLVSLTLIDKRLVEPGAIDVKRVCVLHDEGADTHQSRLGPCFIAKLGLDLVPDLWQLFVRTKLATRNRREHFFVRHAKTHVRAFAIFETKHLVADRLPTARLLPDLSRVKGRQEKFLATDGVHLLAQDLHDFDCDSLAQRQERIDSSRQLPDQTGAQKKLVRNDLGIGRVFAKSGNKVS